MKCLNVDNKIRSHQAFGWKKAFPSIAHGEYLASPRTRVPASLFRTPTTAPRRNSVFPAITAPNSLEVYGFVGSITTIAATAVFIIWAYVPDHWLHSVGIYYYPSRYWALAMPTYLMVTIVLAILFYIGMNFMATPPPTYLNSMIDQFSREPGSDITSRDDDDDDNEEHPIEPISDIGVSQINDIMFKNLK